MEVDKEDIQAAWAVLENLAVSLDQIGAVFGRAKDALHDPKQQRALQEVSCCEGWALYLQHN